jgi:hypothetical protein
VWLVPVALLAGVASVRASRATALARVLAAAAGLALAADAALVAGVHLAAEAAATRRHRADLAALAARPAPITVELGRSTSLRVRLAEHGVRFVEGPLRCAAPRQLLPLSDARYCP